MRQILVAKPNMVFPAANNMAANFAAKKFVSKHRYRRCLYGMDKPFAPG